MGQALAQQLLVCIGMDILLKASGHWAEVDAAAMTIEDDVKMKMQCNVMEDSDVEDCSSVQDTAFPVPARLQHKLVIVTMRWKLKLAQGSLQGYLDILTESQAVTEECQSSIQERLKYRQINQTGSEGSLTVYEQ